MSKFEDPIQFDISKKFGPVELEYSDLIEVSQGGPVLGQISINGTMINGRFGGPTLFNDGYIYIPMYIRGIINGSFRLVKINTSSLTIETLTKNKDLIFLDRIENQRVYFFEDVNKTSLGSCPL